MAGAPEDTNITFYDKESAYLLLTEDGEYHLYMNEDLIGHYTEHSIDADMLASFVVIEEGNN